MKTIGNVMLGAALAAAGMMWGCEGEMRDPSRAARAVESPVERNSASGEIAQLADASGVPLVEVGIPNKRGEKPVVRTIVDNVQQPIETRPPAISITPPITGVGVGNGTTLPATLPATQPATRPALRLDPVLGPQE